DGACPAHRVDLVHAEQARGGEDVGVHPPAELGLRRRGQSHLSDARDLACAVADDLDLTVAFEVFDHFAASINDPDAYAVAVKAMDAIGVVHGDAGVPMRASEDFGVFGWGAKAAMLCLGSGRDHAALHNPDYDFPDDLIPIGSAIFDRIARDLLGTAPAARGIVD
ncbi:MAG: M20/M25/M40 family metallo-hydrolase, partial [Paracoccus sp. (in: a-proteobacteria)]|nr:M20/M25/M40 family metallo-hydrolase [Paracoccus sp. (in: a-proteobacteria)]